MSSLSPEDPLPVPEEEESARVNVGVPTEPTSPAGTATVVDPSDAEATPPPDGAPMDHEPRALARERRLVWLSSWGTFIAGMASALGLIFSAVATFLALAAYQNQTHQAQQSAQQAAQQAADKKNEQAQKVKTWSSGSTSYISNSSEDPIYEVSISPIVIHIGSSSKLTVLHFSSIPPCTVQSITSPVPPSKDANREPPVNLDGVWTLYWSMVWFTDSQGQSWGDTMGPGLGGGPWSRTTPTVGPVNDLETIDDPTGKNYQTARASGCS